MIGSSQRPLPDNTHKRHTHAPGGFRIHNPSKRAAADPRLRPRGQWVRPFLRIGFTDAMKRCGMVQVKQTFTEVQLHISVFRRHQAVDIQGICVTWTLNYIRHVSFSIYRRAMGWAVSCLLVTTEARVRSPASPCEICGGQSGTHTGFSANTLVFPYIIPPPTHTHLFISHRRHIMSVFDSVVKIVQFKIYFRADI